MKDKWESLFTVATPPLIFISSFYSFIRYHDYGLLTIEVILCFTAITLAGLLIGLLLVIAGPTKFRAMGFAILLFVFFDIEFGLIEKINDFLTAPTGYIYRYATLILVLFTVQLAVMGLRKHIATILATVFATAFVSTIIIPGAQVNFGSQPVNQPARPALNTPPVIHLILDGHIGIEGIPNDIDGGKALRESLLSFYERWGFRLYGRAYSKYILTHDSISNLLNGTTSKIAGKMTTISHQHGTTVWKPVENRWFKLLSNNGYRIRVYETDYFDYCQDSVEAIEYCYLYSTTSPQLLQPLDLSSIEKAKFILDSYFFENSFMHITRKVYSSVASILPAEFSVEWKRKNYQFSSLGAPTALSKLKADLVSEPRGRLFFAHLLIPHGPYIWDKNCTTHQNTDTWLSRRMNHKDMRSISDDSYRDSAYKYYFLQIACTVSLLDDLLQTMEKTDILRDATVIVHGDHGSRITIADPIKPMMNYLRNEDYIDSFSTLFAIRSSETIPGYDNKLSAIQSLFSELVLQNEPITDDASVYLLTGPPKQKLPLEVVPIPSF